MRMHRDSGLSMNALQLPKKGAGDCQVRPGLAHTAPEVFPLALAPRQKKLAESLQKMLAHFAVSGT